MELPIWADKDLSSELPVLRAKGEGQNLEYIESFPEQARELGKEIAAFASTNAGMILLGVTNSGDLKGLDDMGSLEERDKLLRRLEGICNGIIKPPITPSVNFAIESDRIILVISVPRGVQPVYYCQNVPYVRHITTSRPAEPLEVIELVQTWISSRIKFTENTGESVKSQFISDLASLLINLLIYGREVEYRYLNPWLDLLMAEFGSASNYLRQLAVVDEATNLGLSEKLEELARKADNVASYSHTLGEESWKCFIALVQDVVESAEEMKKSFIDSLPISRSPKELIVNRIIESRKLLASLSSRAIEMGEKGRIDEVKQQASDCGYKLLKLTQYSLGDLPSDVLDDLRKIAFDLHLTETIRIYLDGGASIHKVEEQIKSAAQELEIILNRLGKGN